MGLKTAKFLGLLTNQKFEYLVDRFAGEAHRFLHRRLNKTALLQPFQRVVSIHSADIDQFADFTRFEWIFTGENRDDTCLLCIEPAVDQSADQVQRIVSHHSLRAAVPF